MAPDYFDSSIEFPELDPMTGLPVGTKGTTEAASFSFNDEDWQKQLLSEGASALESGTFVNPMDIATQEENKKLRSQIEELRAESERAQTEFRAQQDKYVEVLRQLNDRNKEALEEQRIQHEKQIAEMNSHFEALQAASRNAGEKETELRSQLEQIRDEKDQLQRQTEELRRELEKQQIALSDERDRASAELEKAKEEARQTNARLSEEASAKETELLEAKDKEKQELLKQLEEERSKAQQDAETQKSILENRLQFELNRKDEEYAAKLAEVEAEKQKILIDAEVERKRLLSDAEESQRALQEKADQNQAALRERATARINEIIDANTKLQEESNRLSQVLDESNKNNEELAAALQTTQEKLRYSESEQAKRELEATRQKLEEEASLRDQKISEAKALIQQQWNKLQEEKAALELERESVTNEFAAAEEEKKRAVAWQQSTLSERLKLQDAQKKLASDQEEAEHVRAELELIRAEVLEGRDQLNADREAYESRVAEETSERQRQIAAARTFLEKMHKEAEEERANVMMERLAFEKDRDEFTKQLETERAEFEERKTHFRNELEQLANWVGLYTNREKEVEVPVEEVVSEENAPETAGQETTEAPQNEEVEILPQEEQPSVKDFFQDDPVENLFSVEVEPSQDRSESESSQTDDNSVMASPFADLFLEPSLTESLFSDGKKENKEELPASEPVPQVAVTPVEEVESFEKESTEQNKAEEGQEIQDVPEEVTIEDVAEVAPAEETILTQSEEVVASEADETQSEGNGTEEFDSSELELDHPSALEAEIEQKVSELMDTVSQAETETNRQIDYTGNLFDTLTNVDVKPSLYLGELAAENINDLSGQTVEEEIEAPLFTIPDTESKDDSSEEEPFNFDAVTDALNLAMLEKSDFSFTENNLLEDGDVHLIAESVTSKYYVNTESYSYPSFRDVSFVCPSGSCTAVVSDVAFCGYALLRAIATPEELADGSVYVEGHKVGNGDYLYIGSDRLLSKQQTVIEWLVDNAGGNLSEQKERYQQLLEDIGISKWASRTLRSIGYARRMLVLLLASSLHSSKLVLFNDPHFALEPKDEMVARRIFKHLHDSGKTVMIASSDLFTLQSVANRVLILKNGAAAYTGSFKDFLETYSGVSVSFPQEYTEAVKAVTDDRYVLLSAGEGCTLSMKKGEKGSTTDLVHLLESAGVPTESIRNTEKTFALACREVL